MSARLCVCLYVSLVCLSVCVSAPVRRALVLAVYLGLLGALYLSPLGMYSPCIREDGTLGSAPGLIGHRGMPMVRWSTLLGGVGGLMKRGLNRTTL